MNSKREMEERIARAIAGESFRRHVGPGWREVAAEIAASVMSELGMVEIEASKKYPAREEPDIEAHVEASLRDAFAYQIVKETPMSLIVERGKAGDYPGLSRMRLRGWVITRSAPHDQ